MAGGGGGKVMTREQFELLREYVQAEIEYAIASTQRDEEGYTVSHPRERKAAEEAFMRLVNLVGAK